MNRNQIFTTLEFIDDQIRIYVGEYFKEKFYIFDKFVSSSLGLKQGKIVDEDEIIKTLQNLVETAKQKTKNNIKEIVLCLPTNEVKISHTTSTSPVSGKNSTITQSDIDNDHRVAFKVRHDEDQEIVDIVPVEYSPDNLEKLDFAPIGYKSSTFKVLYNVLTMPKDLMISYRKIIKASKLEICDLYLDINSLYSGAVAEDDLDVAILNLNKHSTNLSVFKKGRLFDKFSIDAGINDLVLAVKEEYQVDYKKALRLVLLHSNAKKSLSFDFSVFKIENEGKEMFIKEQELAIIIEKELNVIFEKLIFKTNNILRENLLDVIITGYGSCIKNIDAKFAQLAKVETTTFRSKVIGINEPNATQTIGLIRLNYLNLGQNNYKNLQIQKKDGIIVPSEEEISSTSKFKKFILDKDEFE